MLAVRVIALGMAVLAGSASAQTPTPSAQDSLRPTGPVTLTADRGEWAEGGEMLYEGNVSLQSDTLKLTGASMRVTQLADGQFQAQIFGEPAKLDHAGRPGAAGAAGQTVSAAANRIDYDSRRGIIELNEKARLLRGGDEVTGNKIDYVVAERRVRASGGGGSGQVRIVIQPPQSSPSPTPAPTESP